MKAFLIPYSGGSLGKNSGTEKAPEILGRLFREKKEVYVPSFESLKYIEKNAKFGKKTVFLGGDHSITYALFKSFAKKYINHKLLWFDAHADCMHYWKAVSHEDVVKCLVEENVLNPKNVLMIGVRKKHKIEEDFLKKKKIKFFSCKNRKEIEEELKKFVSRGNTYLSLDIDVLDYDLVPGTGYREKKGFKERELLSFLETALNGRVKAVDLVEVNPLKDRSKRTLKAAERILKKVKSLW